MKCNVCGQEFGEGLLCKHCGADRIVGIGKFSGYRADTGTQSGQAPIVPQIQNQNTNIGNMLCFHCGEIIPAESKYCPYCSISQYVNCPYCGYHYPARFPACSNCGTNRESYYKTIEENRKREEQARKEKEERERRAAEERRRQEEVRRQEEERKRREREAREAQERLAAEEKRRQEERKRREREAREAQERLAAEEKRRQEERKKKEREDQKRIENKRRRNRIVSSETFKKAYSLLIEFKCFIEKSEKKKRNQILGISFILWLFTTAAIMVLFAVAYYFYQGRLDDFDWKVIFILSGLTGIPLMLILRSRLELLFEYSMEEYLRRYMSSLSYEVEDNIRNICSYYIGKYPLLVEDKVIANNLTTCFIPNLDWIPNFWDDDVKGSAQYLDVFIYFQNMFMDFSHMKLDFVNLPYSSKQKILSQYLFDHHIIKQDVDQVIRVIISDSTYWNSVDCMNIDNMASRIIGAIRLGA